MSKQATTSCVLVDRRRRHSSAATAISARRRWRRNDISRPRSFPTATVPLAASVVLPFLALLLSVILAIASTTIAFAPAPFAPILTTRSRYDDSTFSMGAKYKYYSSRNNHAYLSKEANDRSADRTQGNGSSQIGAIDNSREAVKNGSDRRTAKIKNGANNKNKHNGIDNGVNGMNGVSDGRRHPSNLPTEYPVDNWNGTTLMVSNNNTADTRDHDSIICECDADDHGDAIDALYASLLAKVEFYLPQAIGASSPAASAVNENASLSNATADLLTPILRRAYSLARSAHEGQCRKSGEPYITHPLGVAHIVADMQLDLPSLLTALLHDTVEDTDVTLEDIRSEFGEEVAQLVDGVTKVGKKIPIPWSYEEEQSENYRKFILSMSRDIRVLLVKLADRAHNIRTLRHLPPEKQRRIAKETMEIHAPLAHRLGIYWLKTELEDGCFRYLHPERYKLLDTLVRGSEAERTEYEETVVDMLEEKMTEAGVGRVENGTLVVTGRTKGLYSIHNKMRRKNIDFNDVHDVLAFRIIVNDVASCYQALGVVHSHFKPVPGKIKDYIALPKPNGYRSLHTTIIGPRGKLEVQIRTGEMDQVAEAGVAAHWIYKEDGGDGRRGPRKGGTRRYAWLRELVQEVRRQSDPQEFVESVKEDLTSTKEVFVFTPKGDLYALARGSSVLDFAFKVHSQIGSRCIGAKVNGRQVTLKHLIKNGDTVEVLTSNSQTPKREWLKYVRTSKAKNRIRSYLKRRQRERSIIVGKKMIEQGLKKYSSHGVDGGKKEYQRKMSHLLTTFKLKDANHLLMALGYGQITLESVMIEVFGAAAVNTRGKQNKREKDDQYVLSAKRSAYLVSQQSSTSFNKNGIIVGQERNILLKFCKNCNPLMGEKIRGVVSQGKGVTIHRLGCKYLLEADDERIVDVQWDEDRTNVRRRPVQLHVLCEDTPGVLADMSHAISSLGINIGNVNLRKLPNGRGVAKMQVMVGKLDELEKVMAQLRKEDGILSVSRR